MNKIWTFKPQKWSKIVAKPTFQKHFVWFLVKISNYTWYKKKSNLLVTFQSNVISCLKINLKYLVENILF